MKGLLISFDGLDSSGKATQSRQLVSYLQGKEALVKQFTSPDYATVSGQELRLRLQGKLGNWHDTPWQEKMGYFAANRAEHKTEVIELLNQGGIVVYDRYVPSSIAFMAAEARGESRETVYSAVSTLEYETNGMPKEGVSLFFDIPPRLAIDLLERRKHDAGDANEYTDYLAVQEALYNEYVALCEQYPEQMIRIACMDGDRLRSIDEIAQEVRATLAQTFPEHVSLFA